MMVIQRANVQGGDHPTRVKVYHFETGIGYEAGQHLNLFQKGETLLYTLLQSYPGFELIANPKVIVRGGPMAIVPREWAAAHLDGSHLVQAIYSKHGVFIREHNTDFSAFVNPDPKIKGTKKNPAVEVMVFFNEERKKYISGSRGFSVNGKKYLSLINTQLRKGFTVDDCKAVIAHKCKSWGPIAQREYLQPKTLFADIHFESYLIAAESAIVQQAEPEKDYIREAFDKQQGYKQ